jgi:hypothetical protein
MLQVRVISASKYGDENWTLYITNRRKIETAEMKF